jgi:hypothetical protein
MAKRMALSLDPIEVKKIRTLEPPETFQLVHVDKRTIQGFDEFLNLLISLISEIAFQEWFNSKSPEDQAMFARIYTECTTMGSGFKVVSRRMRAWAKDNGTVAYLKRKQAPTRQEQVEFIRGKMATIRYGQMFSHTDGYHVPTMDRVLEWFVLEAETNPGAKVYVDALDYFIN